MVHHDEGRALADAVARSDQMAKQYEERIESQRSAIGRFVEYLTERGLLQDYNTWNSQERK